MTERPNLVDKPSQPGSDARAALLQARLRGGRTNAAETREIEESNVAPAGPIALSPYQQPLWLDYQLFPLRRIAWVVRGYLVAGSLDQQRLCRALEQLQARHWSLTAAISSAGQMLARQRPIPLRVWSCADDPWSEMATFCREKMPGFRFEDGELLRVYVAAGADRFALVLAMHHILVDPESIELLERELDRLYQLPAAPLEAVVSPSAVYAGQLERLEQRKPDLVQFWRQQLADLPPATPLPWARPGRKQDSTGQSGGLVRQPLAAELGRRIWQAASDSGGTPYQWLLSAWCILLAHYWQRTDIHLGTLFSLRTTAAQRRALGYLQNLIVLRVDLSQCRTFQEVLAAVQTEVAQAMLHRDLPMHELRQILEGRSAFGSLFSSLFTVLDNSRPDTFLGGPLCQRQSLDYGGAAFDCSFFFIADRQSPALAIEYNTALYRAADMDSVLQHFQRVLLQCLESCEHQQALEWRHYRLVSDADFRAVQQQWRKIADDVRETECLHHAFEGQVATRPDHIAVTWTDGIEQHQLSYRQLSQRADAVAGFLTKLELLPEEPVALMARWHPESIAAILGILRSGCAYLPIDPDYPAARIAHMLQDSGCNTVLSERELALPAALQAVCYPLSAAISFAADDTSPRAQCSPHGLAYLIYTSGSSGPAKGVMVEHRAAVYSTRQRSLIYEQFPPRKYLLLSSIAFDSAVAGLWWTLSTGGTLCLTTPGMTRAADRLAALIQRQSITHTLCLPSQWRNICRMAPCLDSLQLVIVAGEACDAKVSDQHFKVAPQAALYNEYGPTEMTVWSTWQRISPPDRDPIAIGEPLPQTQALILDAWGNLVPDGLTGELCLAGAGIARGYVGDTADASDTGFIEHPLDAGARAYLTGDRVSRDQQGRLYFEGRVDEQVKCRGYRVGIENLEATLRRAGTTALAVLPWNGDSLEVLLQRLPESEARAILARYSTAHTSN
jgi:amino acid adenylation domain-containing protein